MESVAPADEASRAEHRALELMQRARELRQLHVDAASLRDVAHELGERAGRVADDDVAAEQIPERAFRVERGLAELSSGAREAWAGLDQRAVERYYDSIEDGGAADGGDVSRGR